MQIRIYALISYPRNFTIKSRFELLEVSLRVEILIGARFYYLASNHPGHYYVKMHP